MKFKYQKFFLGGDATRSLISRPYLPIRLHRHGDSTAAAFFALLDSGADSVLMPAEFAKELGIQDVKTGKKVPTEGIAGQRAEVYYHDVEVELIGDSRKLSVAVGFSDQIHVPLLGRSFFLYFKMVTFNEAKEEVELRT